MISYTLKWNFSLLFAPYRNPGGKALPCGLPAWLNVACAYRSRVGRSQADVDIGYYQIYPGPQTPPAGLLEMLTTAGSNNARESRGMDIEELKRQYFENSYFVADDAVDPAMIDPLEAAAVRRVDKVRSGRVYLSRLGPEATAVYGIIAPEFGDPVFGEYLCCDEVLCYVIFLSRSAHGARAVVGIWKGLRPGRRK